MYALHVAFGRPRMTTTSASFGGVTWERSYALSVDVREARKEVIHST